MRERAAHGGRAGVVGPVEAGPGAAESPPGGPEVPAGRSRPGARVMRQWLVAAALGAAALAADSVTPWHPTPPMPWPAQATTMVFTGAPGAGTGGLRSFTLRARISVTGPGPVTVTAVAQPYAGLALRVSPPLPFQVSPGGTRTIGLHFHVRDCGRTPTATGLPYLDVTLRNARATQTESEILGNRYARALDAALTTACLTSRGHIAASPS